MSRALCSCGAWLGTGPENPVEFGIFHEMAGHYIVSECERKIGPYPCCSVVQGDCLELMKQLPDGCVDAVITDPPYMLTTTSAYGNKLNPWADLCNGSVWFSTWYAEVKRFLHIGGVFWTFLNWRSIVTIQKAAMDSGWPIESLLVWDKDWIGPGGHRGLRPSYELVALLVHQNGGIKNRSLYDIQTFPWSSQKLTGHPAEKPEELMAWLIRESSEQRQTILDPFCGSGTTLVAAKKLGRHYLGFEISEEYCRIARERIARVEAQPSLFQPKPEQMVFSGISAVGTGSEEE